MPKLRECLAIAIAVAATSPALSAATVWNGGAGLWNSTNWSAGVPDAATDARIDNNTAINSTVTVSTNAAAASLVLDVNDKIILGNGAGVTLTTSSIGNAGTIVTGGGGALYGSVSATGIIVNNGLIDTAGGSTLFLDSQAIVNNGLISVDAPSGPNPAHLVLNNNNAPNGLSYSGFGNISVAALASLIINNPVNSTATGWLNVDGSVLINALSNLSFGSLHGGPDATITSASTGLSSLAVTNGSASLDYEGTLSGNLSLSKSGMNTLILANDNSYAGTTDVYGGRLQLDNPTPAAGAPAPARSPFTPAAFSPAEAPPPASPPSNPAGPSPPATTAPALSPPPAPSSSSPTPLFSSISPLPQAPPISSRSPADSSPPPPSTSSSLPTEPSPSE